MGGGSFSHDEKKILITNDESGIFNLYSLSVEDSTRTQLTYSDTNSLIATSYFPNDDRILFRSDNNGDEIYHIFLREPDGSVKNLTPYEGARSLFYGWMFDKQSFIYGSNRRDKRFMDVYEVDINDFSEKMLYQNDEGLDFDGISRDKNMPYLLKV
jgi:Tol biopolymer transport system component